MSYSRLVQSHHEDGHQVTKPGNLWQPGGEDWHEGSEHTEFVEEAGKEDEEAADERRKGN